MVGSHGDYQLSRSSPQPHKKHVHLHAIADTLATTAPLRSSKQAISRVLGWFRGGSGRAASSYELPSAQKAPPAADKDPTHSALSINDYAANGSTKQHPGQQQQGKDTFLVQDQEGRSSGNPVPAQSAPSTIVSILGDFQDDSSTAFVINPRLSLVFSDVWVADRSIEPGLSCKVRKGFGRLRGTISSLRSEGSSHIQDEPIDCPVTARLYAAAADGAFFIVPGVSSRFDHSQLHAIMGPSGCGKTTLCRALAGRLPMNRVCGNISVFCSSAEDGFRSESELVVSDSSGASTASRDLSQTTGFVPQFDLLHETLTVRGILI